MERVLLKVNGAPDVAFVGEDVARVYDSFADVLTTIYETEKGNWFLAVTNNESVLVRQKVIENKSAEDLKNVLGYSDLAKSLYEQLGIDTTNNLDI